MYTPSLIELDGQSKSALGRYPQLFQRAERAKQILHDQQLDFCTTTQVWTCRSASRDKAYRIINDQCSCPDATNDTQWSAPNIGGKRFCKHLIAYLLLKEIYHAHLNNRISEIQSFWPGQLRLIGNIVKASPNDEPVCRVTHHEEHGLRFHRQLDMHLFGLWLEQHSSPAAAELLQPVESMSLAA